MTIACQSSSAQEDGHYLVGLTRIGLRGPLMAPVEPPGRGRVAPRRGEGLPARLRTLLRALRATGRRAAAGEEILRALAVPRSVDGVAGRLVDLGFDWLGGQGWATLVQEEGRGLVWLADRGVRSTRRPAVTALAGQVISTGQTEWHGDASRIGPSRLRSPFAVLALPLWSGGHVTGVLAGVDKATSTTGGGTRALPAGREFAVLRLLLDPLAGALDAAARLARAQRLSSVDDLTGLYNSRFLAGAMQRESKRALRTRRPLSLLFVDLDGFKGINDRWGHLCGSRALVEAAERIRQGARETDIVARYGGDEFAVVLPDTPEAGAIVVGQRVRDRIARHSFLESEGIQYRLTASVGVATLPDAARTPEDLLAAADSAMYRVKARGKDGIEVGRGRGAATA